MAAADSSSTTWYEAYASGDEGRRVDGEVDGEEEYEEVEVEEMTDDEPMHITGRLFLGSIDAARNISALKRLRIGAALALLGKGEEGAAVPSHTSTVAEVYAELQIARKIVEIEDSKDGDLLRRLPRILAALKKLVEKVEQESKSVLVHCIAGRSRSAAVVAAWMLVNSSERQSVQDCVDQIRIIRPWIEINPHFIRDLHLFQAILASTHGALLSSEKTALLKDRSFPRLDFGANLVEGVLQGTKTITMRLLPDVESDHNSDLKDIYLFSLVAATTSSTDDTSMRPQFAYLRIDQIETKELSGIDDTTLHKSGFASTDEVMAVLKQFYPNVTATTPLLMLHFHCLSPITHIQDRVAIS
ncbi:hypothetical protein KRP22_012780 [Phytophthora ramorum]|nr:putative tyrosine phosphatase 123R [Phytophthora ramorum]